MPEKGGSKDDEAKDGETKDGGSKNDETKIGESKSGEPKSGESKSGEAKDVKPEQKYSWPEPPLGSPTMFLYRRRERAAEGSNKSMAEELPRADVDGNKAQPAVSGDAMEEEPPKADVDGDKAQPAVSRDARLVDEKPQHKRRYLAHDMAIEADQHAL